MSITIEIENQFGGKWRYKENNAYFRIQVSFNTWICCSDLQSIPALCNCLFSIGLSSLVSGHTPALACAPNNRVADCLAIILAHMPLSPTPNNVYPRTGRYDSSTPNNTFGKWRQLKSFTDDGHHFMLTFAEVSHTVNVKDSSF